MVTSADIPTSGSYILSNCRIASCLIEDLPIDMAVDKDGLVGVDITITNGKLAKFSAPGESTGLPHLDLGSRFVWPCFVDVHTHIDKGHIWPRKRNPNGTRPGALSSTAEDREKNWTKGDVRSRMDFSLRCAYAHGTAAMRTHLDSTPPQHTISWPVISELRETWAERITLQAVCLEPIWGYEDKGFGVEIADMMVEFRGILGAVLNIQENTDKLLDFVIGLAIERDLELDFHVDEMGAPDARSFDNICRALLRNGYPKPVNVGHCCSLAVRPENEVKQALDLAKAANIRVTSLPMCNMFLQGRSPGVTPRWRGVTILHEFKTHGVPASIASDNVRDPFYAYGDLDVFEVFSQAVRIAQLDYPVGDWPSAVTCTPADTMGLPNVGRLKKGGSADIVIFNARNYSELFPRPQTDRVIIRNGRVIDTTPPDYRELDGLILP